MQMTTFRFKTIIRDHYQKHKRNMPWRETGDSYRILVSEVMLQQTQVSRVMNYYPDFIKKFPDFRSLARAKTYDVLMAWQGLGYNRRALALQKLSKILLEKFNGTLPQTREDLESLPGIGKATAGSLLAFVFNKPEVFIETNIRRVFIHFFFPKRKKVTDVELERYIKSTLDRKNPREWYWALMDYGSELGASGRGIRNPNRKSAHYKKQSPFSGSDRELRGKILKVLLKQKKFSVAALAKSIQETAVRTQAIADGLSREGFIKRKGQLLFL
jgi:A/G-specific adenine glycosylase